MIREGYEIADIQQAVMGFLRAKTVSSAPWTSWAVVEGWPNQTVFETFTKPFLYCHSPLMIEQVQQQGGGKPRFNWELVVGGWTDREKGGSEEAAIMQSALMRLFANSAVNAVTFSGTVAGTAFTAKTLPQIGVVIDGIQNPRSIEFEQEDDFRGEVSILLTA
ncbi:MAG TPA: hypothetical protein PKN24_15970 [bacterium]|nr:hypothetical protein [bacterium]